MIIEIGKKYKVTLSDCCIQGSFVAVLDSIVIEKDEETINSMSLNVAEESYGNLQFLGKIVLTNWTGCTFEEVE